MAAFSRKRSSSISGRSKTFIHGLPTYRRVNGKAEISHILVNTKTDLEFRNVDSKDDSFLQEYSRSGSDLEGAINQLEVTDLIGFFEKSIINDPKDKSLSQEDWKNLMVDETVRIPAKAQRKKKPVRELFQDTDLQEKNDSSSVSLEQNWKNLDMGKKERRLRTLINKNEALRIALDNKLKKSIPEFQTILEYGMHEKFDIIKTTDIRMLFELGDKNTTFKEQMELLHIEKKKMEINYYKDCFAHDDHRNYIGTDPCVGPVVVSIQSQRKDKEGRINANSRVLIRTSESDKWIFFPSKSKSSEILLSVKKMDPRFAKIRFEKIKSEKIVSELLKFEASLSFEVNNMKVGVLPVKIDQINENEMFANQLSDLSKEFEEFLNFVAEKITLNGWNKYAGGLNTTADLTGTHSFFTEFEDYSIMFHVSPLLPYTPDDEQQLERKRHLGNDIIIIIWLEEGVKNFDPACLTTNFTYIFIVIQYDGKTSIEKGLDHYKFSVATKEGTRPFSPRIPLESLPKGEELHEFFYTKLINSQRAALEAPAFKGKIKRTREILLQDILKSNT